MPEEQVVAENPTPPVVNEGVVATEQDSTPVEEAQQPESATPEAVKDEGDIDEKGVPYKNRYMEAQRKLQSLEQNYNGLQSQLPNLIQEAVAKAIPQKAETSHSKEDLIRFKNNPDTPPEHRAWAEIELEKIRSKETEEIFRNQSQAKERQMAIEAQKQAAFGYVRNNYSAMFNPDGSFNETSPLTQKTFRILNSDETLRNHPHGIRVAADMALAEHIRESQPDLMKQTNKLKRQVKKLQTATLIEGNGQPQTIKTPNPMKSAMERLSQTGDKNAAKAVAAELIKTVHAGLV